MVRSGGGGGVKMSEEDKIRGQYPFERQKMHFFKDTFCYKGASARCSFLLRLRHCKGEFELRREKVNLIRFCNSDFPALGISSYIDLR